MNTVSRLELLSYLQRTSRQGQLPPGRFPSLQKVMAVTLIPSPPAHPGADAGQGALWKRTPRTPTPLTSHNLSFRAPPTLLDPPVSWEPFKAS